MDDVTRGVKDMMDAAIDAKMPVMLVGSPGTGKTSVIKQIAEERGYKLITLVGSRMDPTDVSGLPKAVTVGEDENSKPIEATVNLSPSWQVDIMKHKKVILFFDEFSNSPSSVQAAFLTILQDREFANGHKFPEETVIIGAANAVEEAADGYEMSLPTTNRIMWVTWEPTVKSWIEGMRKAWGKKVSDVEQGWKDKIASFIDENPTWIQQFPVEAESAGAAYGLNSNSASQQEVFRSAWASRRSWDNLSRVLAHAPNSEYVQDSIAQGIVGYAAAGVFREWLVKNDNINPHEVIKDPTIIDWKNLDIDSSNILFRGVNDSITEKNAMKVIHLFDYVAEQGRASIAGSFVQEMFQNVMNRKFSQESLNKHKKACLKMLPKFENVTANAS